MILFRVAVHGHVIEARRADFITSEEIRLDGRRVSRRPWYSLFKPRHRFTLVDESGSTRRVEVSILDAPMMGPGDLEAVVMIDGTEYARVEPVHYSAPGTCSHCGYRFDGLTAHAGVFQCPECGRHTPIWAPAHKPSAP